MTCTHLSDILHASALWHRHLVTDLPEAINDALIDAAEAWAGVWS